MPALLVQDAHPSCVAETRREKILRPSSSVGELPSEYFEPSWWERRKAVFGTARGRGTVYFVEGAEGRWALRHYMRGGWMSRCTRDRYLWTGLARTRTCRELELLAQLHADGLPVPRPIGARLIRTGCSYTGDIITEFLPSSTPLGEILKAAPLSRSDWAALGCLLRRFHHHRVRHDDINIGNILRDADGQFHLIDFDNARLTSPGAWRLHNLLRLRRSLEKARRRNPSFYFTSTDWDSLQSGYEAATFNDTTVDSNPSKRPASEIAETGDRSATTGAAAVSSPGPTWRLRTRLRLLLRPASSQRPVAVTLLGQQVSLQLHNGREVDRIASFDHEATLVRHIVDHLKPGDVVYDVGANIGLIGLVLALHPNGRESRIHSFEPEPRNFQQLERNIAANDLGGRMTPHQLALGAKAGHAGLYVRGTAGEGRHSLVAAKGATGCIDVQVASVSEFAEASGDSPDVMKIDVEGAEGQVLAGMEALLRSRAPREIFMEIHNKGDKDQMPDGQLIGSWLEERGYTLQWEQQRRSGIHRHYTTKRPPG